jgi:hypothetical protein
MRITLDLTDLVARGALTKEEAERLKVLASGETGSLGANIFFAFGAIAVTLGIGALLPHPFTAAALGLLLFITGLTLSLTTGRKWWLFAQICMTIGTLAAWGGLSFLSDGSLAANMLLLLALGAAAALARSGLLAALAVLALTAVLGGGTEYWHATYAVSIWQPTLTILVLSVLAIALTLLATQVDPAYERICLIAARTAAHLNNLAFWIGSLWGDLPFQNPAFGGLVGFRISPEAFGIAWAILLVIAGLWGVRSGRRWVVNTAAVFGAIHFYTQWFENLGLSPMSVLLGGLLLIVVGFLLVWLNRRVLPGAVAQPA